MWMTWLWDVSMLTHLWSRLHEIWIRSSLCFNSTRIRHGARGISIWRDVWDWCVVTRGYWALWIISSMNCWMALVWRVGCDGVVSRCVWKVHWVWARRNTLWAWTSSSLWFEYSHDWGFSGTIWSIDHRLHHSTASIDKPSRKMKSVKVDSIWKQDGVEGWERTRKKNIERWRKRKIKDKKNEEEKQRWNKMKKIEKRSWEKSSGWQQQRVIRSYSFGPYKLHSPNWANWSPSQKTKIKLSVSGGELRIKIRQEWTDRMKTSLEKLKQKMVKESI